MEDRDYLFELPKKDAKELRKKKKDAKKKRQTNRKDGDSNTCMQ